MKPCIVERAFAFVFGCVAAVLYVCWAARLAIAGNTWIRFGYWQEYQVYELFNDMSWPIPQTKLVGIQKIFDWCMEQSATVAFFLVASLVAWIGVACAQAAEECSREYERRKKREEYRRAHPNEPEYALDDLINGKLPPNQ